MHPVRLLAAFLALLPATLFAGPQTDGEALDAVLFDQAFWKTPLADLKARFEPAAEEGDGEEDALRAELLEKLREQGIDIDLGEDGAGPGAFAWLSAEQQGLRAPGGNFTLTGEAVGEVVIRTTDGTSPGELAISLYNRGDDGLLPLTEYEKRLAGWKQRLAERLGPRPDERNEQGNLETTGWMWKKDGVAWLLEGSTSKREKRAEFIRLRAVPLNASGGRDRGRIARRGTLDDNVVRKDDGDVHIEGIPMVDQGDKGYCVVATVERIARYFGADLDQHDVAKLANTDDRGTDADDMEEAFRDLTGEIHARTLKHIEFDDRQFEKDFRSYNRLAKRKGVWYDERDFDDWYLDPRYFWFKADKEVFRKMKKEQAKYDHFNRKIKEYVDQGIPLAWTLYLGMFKEGDLPQSFGGHMRLIIGYNEKTEEIIYSDSWGEGHAYKRMPAANAWCMTTGLYTMVPNK